MDWSTQLSVYYEQMKSVKVTFEASMNINNDDIMLENFLLKLELLMELSIIKYASHRTVDISNIFSFS